MYCEVAQILSASVKLAVDADHRPRRLALAPEEPSIRHAQQIVERDAVVSPAIALELVELARPSRAITTERARRKRALMSRTMRVISSM
jgi:hypothetical protein